MRACPLSLRSTMALVLGLESAFAIGIMACASADDTTAAALDAGVPETPVPAPPDAAPEAEAIPAEASTRACSDESFCHTELPPNATLRGVWGDGTIVWSVSEEGDVLRWDGAAWTVHASELGALFAVWGSTPTDLWVGGANGLFHGTGSTPQTITFEPATAPGDAEIPLRSIWGTSGSDVWAVGGHLGTDFLPHGKVLHWDGAGWTLDPISSEPLAFTRVWGSTAHGTWIGGDDTTDYSFTAGFYHRAPSAGAFDPVTIDAFRPIEGPDMGRPATFSAGGIGADGHVVIVGKTAGFTPSFWFGARDDDAGTYAWSYEERDLNDPQLRVVWSIVGAPTWVAGDYGRIRSRAAAGWTQAAIMIGDFPVTAPLYGMWGTKPDDFWVVGKEIAMHRKPGAP